MKDILANTLTGDYTIFDSAAETFNYDCVQCGNCCQNLTVTIDPYDVLRLKKVLKRSTTEIMKNHLGIMQEENTGWPIAFLKTAQTSRCEFNKSDKCLVWEDRPKVCRLFPIGMAASVQSGNETTEKLFYLLKRSNKCSGFEQPKHQTVQEWLDSSQLEPFITEYDKFTALKYYLLSKYDFNSLDPSRIMLLCMALYDFNALYSFVENSEQYSDELQLSKSLEFFQWLVQEIVPDKNGRYNATMLSPEMPQEVFFGALEKKFLEIINN